MNTELAFIYLLIGSCFSWTWLLFTCRKHGSIDIHDISWGLLLLTLWPVMLVFSLIFKVIIPVVWGGIDWLVNLVVTRLHRSTK
jgi:hypothetical protein